MPEPRAHRTLVKSPPELWAEVSDAAALARHLGAFGEIRITRLEPETTVAWEGDRGRGTVELEPAGWGTKVTLTAELARSHDGEETTPAEPAPFDPEPEPSAPTGPDGALELGGQAGLEPPGEAEPPGPAEPPDEPQADADPPMPRRGFFARLFRRRRASRVPRAQRMPEIEAEPPAPEPPPVAAVPQSAAPEAPPAGEAPPLDDAGAVGILTGVLDDLGAAHHRPFSRG